jgi:hypothetical protein
MTLRKTTAVVCLLDAALWVFVAFAMFSSEADPATSGLDQAAGYIVTALFLITTAPALALTVFGRAPKTAFALALIFPGAFAALFIAAIAAFA